MILQIVIICIYCHGIDIKFGAFTSTGIKNVVFDLVNRQSKDIVLSTGEWGMVPHIFQYWKLILHNKNNAQLRRVH